ncbi:MAG TPA: ABC transporter permease subunit [Planctomycetota bacterium]|nr:ABC transporter permease subunit [Planctomycetota bacterium]
MSLSLLHAPILSKELIEQAARPRTYVLRVTYAVLLFAAFLTAVHGVTVQLELGDSVVGSGRRLFALLVCAQFTGILLFVPALMSGALTEEKEGRTLELLLLTRVRPWQILCEKFVGRLVPALTFLVLSLPLLAVCYALGGMSAEDLLVGAGMLFETCLQVGALALMCSAFCRTNLGAFLASYALVVSGWLLCRILPASIIQVGVLWEVVLPLSLGSVDFGGVTFRASVPTLLSIAASLLLARVFLVRRALAGPTRPLAGLFRRLDGFLERHGLAQPLRRRYRGHVRPRADLPDRQPIAWREVAKTPLVKPAHLVYGLALVELFVLFSLGVADASRNPAEVLVVLLGVLWVLASAAVLGLSVSAISTERSSQTLEVLLATPIAGRDIVRQKLRGVQRIIRGLLLPFGTVFLVQLWWARTGGRLYRLGPGVQQLSYVFLACGSVALFLWLFAWFSMWVGLRTPSRPRAVLTSVVGLLVWSGVPVLAFALAVSGTSFYYLKGWEALLLLVSPAGCVWAVEVYPGLYWDVSEGMGLMVAALVLHAGLLFLFRALCLRRADRYLGRARPRRRTTSGGFFYAPPEQ